MKHSLIALLIAGCASSFAQDSGPPSQVQAKPCLPQAADGVGTNFQWTVLPSKDVLATWWCGTQAFGFVAKAAWKPIQYKDRTQMALEISRLNVLYGYASDADSYLRKELIAQQQKNKPGK